MNETTIYVYIQDACFHCHDQINWMETEGYKFTTKEVSNSENREEFFSYGASGTPFTVIKKDKEEDTKIQGFQKEKLQKILN